MINQNNKSKREYSDRCTVRVRQIKCSNSAIKIIHIKNVKKYTIYNKHIICITLPKATDKEVLKTTQELFYWTLLHN